MQPTHGQIIVFSKVPAGSYCLFGAVYWVDRPKAKGRFRFERIEGGSSTYDADWAVARAEWRGA